MVWRLTVVVFCLMLSVPLAWSENDPTETITDFLKHRNVLLTLEFDPASNDLSLSSRNTLDQVVPDLKTLLDDRKLVRIEGFASTTGKQGPDLLLSMQRAMMVQFYLQKNYGLDLHLFFNGYGSSKPSDPVVQLAFYDDTLGLAVAEFDEVITE